MKKILLLLILSTNLTFSQIDSYGIDLGINIYDIEVKGDLSSGTGISFINIGGFIDWKFSNKIGIKNKLVFSKIKEDSYDISIGGPAVESFARNIEINNFQLHSLIKYYFNQNYGTGFYLTAGPKIMYVYNIESESSKIEIEELYKKFNASLLFGFGSSLNKSINFELLLDYGFTNSLNFENNKSQNFGAILNLSFEIDKWI